MKTASPHPIQLELRDVPASDPRETIRRGQRLISRKVGMIRRVATTRYQAQDPVVFCTGVLPADFSRTLDGGGGLQAGGAGDTATQAMASAIGEAVERHCASFFNRDQMVRGTFRELRDDAVSPHLLRLYSRAQIDQFGPDGPDYFDEDTTISWVWGYSLTARRPRLVPASLVYLTYRADSDEAHIGHCASTGLAAAPTREEAILGALLETVERDAFTLAWMHRRGHRPIVVDHQEVEATLRMRLRTDRPSVDVRLFDLTTDLSIPVVFIVMRRQAECGPVTCVGAASRLSPHLAVRKCIQEAGQNFPYLRYLLDTERNWEPAPDFSNLTSFDHHFLLYLKRPELVARAFAFLDECQDRVALSEMPDRSTGRVLADLEYCVARLGEAGYEVVVADITTPDIAAIDLSAVRVIVPGLVPLHADHRRPFLGNRRLHTAPALLGRHPRESSAEAGFNPYPHPFP